MARDGTAWKQVSRVGQYKDFFRGLAFGNGHFLAIGGDPGSVGSSSPFVARSDDGMKWSEYLFISGKHILRRSY
jgi:hypothetical protein